MKKKLISTLLILCVLLTLLPGAALAEDATEVTVGGVTLNAQTPYWKNDGSTSAAEPTDGWNAKFESGTLTLKNATIAGAESGGDNCGIYATGALTIVLEGANSVTAGDSTTGSSYGIHANGALTINGTGSLTATGGAATGTNCTSCGIFANGILTIKGTGLLTATGGTASVNNSINGSSTSYGMFGISVTIEGSATVTATGGAASSINSTSCGVYGFSSVTVKGGTVTATGGESGNNSFGIDGDSSVTVNGGTVTAVGGEAQGGISGGIFSSNGNVDVSGTDTKVVAVGGKAGTNSYGVYANDASGTITYTSGLLVAKGGTRAMNKAGSDTVLSGAFNGNYVVYGDGDTYAVYTTSQTNSILNNDIIIGDGSAAALTCESELALSGFNVVLASGSNSAVHQTSGGGLSLTGTGTLVAVGGSDGGYGIETSNPINPGDSSVVAVGKTGATSNTVQRQEQLVVTGARSKPVMTWVPAMMKVGTTNCASFEAGWNTAIAASSTAEHPVAVKLLADWTATPTKLMNVGVEYSTTTFGTGAGFGPTGNTGNNSGNILVPAGKCITLDLNGHKIDRDGPADPTYGSVIRVGTYNGTIGSLTLLDSGTGGTITGGYDNAAGGVVIENNGTFTMDSGKITGNNGGGVYVNANGTFNVSGTAQVTDNFSDGIFTNGVLTGGTEKRNVYLPDGKTVTVTGELQDGAAIGVTARTTPTDDAPVIVAQGGGTPSHTIDADDAACFTSDNTAYGVGFDSEDSKLKLSTAYTVTYNSNGGSEIADNNGDHSYTIFTVGFDLPDVPTKSGYTFKGWKVTVGALSGTGFVQDAQYPDDVNLISLTKATGNVTLTAQWTPNAPVYYPSFYTLTFVTNGGEDVADVKKPSGSTIDLSTYTPKREGYTFTGWFADEALNEKLTDVKLTKNAAVYAGWEWVNPFSDVTASDWFYADAEYVAAKGLFKGETETEFAPEKPMTRAMLAEVLYRLEGEPTVMFVREPDKAFSDVEDGAWYEKAVQWAQLNGIVEGSDGKFMPDAEISREELATMLYRYEQYKGGGFTGSWMFPLGFKDAASVSDWAYEALCWMTMNKLMQGDGDNLMPKAPATRAQVAAMLHRFTSIEK